MQFVPSPEEGAFGFLDPNDVIRGTHLIPCFNKGIIVNPLPPASRWDYPSNANWQNYYINQ